MRNPITLVGKDLGQTWKKKQTQIGTAMKPKAHIECARMYAVHPVKHELLQRKEFAPNPPGFRQRLASVFYLI